MYNNYNKNNEPSVNAMNFVFVGSDWNFCFTFLKFKEESGCIGCHTKKLSLQYYTAYRHKACNC